MLCQEIFQIIFQFPVVPFIILVEVKLKKISSVGLVASEEADLVWQLQMIINVVHHQNCQHLLFQLFVDLTILSRRTKDHLLHLFNDGSCCLRLEVRWLETLSLGMERSNDL